MVFGKLMTTWFANYVEVLLSASRISVTLAHRSFGSKTPFSVMIPFIKLLGVTSNAGFQLKNIFISKSII